MSERLFFAYCAGFLSCLFGLATCWLRDARRQQLGTQLWWAFQTCALCLLGSVVCALCAWGTAN